MQKYYNLQTLASFECVGNQSYPATFALGAMHWFGEYKIEAPDIGILLEGLIRVLNFVLFPKQ